MKEQFVFRWLKNKQLLERVDKNYELFTRVLKESLSPKHERVLIIGDLGYRKRNLSAILSACYYKAAKELGLDTRIIFQKVKKRGESASKKTIEALGLHKEYNIIIANVSNKLGKLDSIGLSFRRFCKANNHRFISTTSLGDIYNKDFSKIIGCIDINYNKSRRIHEKIKKILDEGHRIEVKTKSGTDFRYNIKGMKAISADGIYRDPGDGGNLPAGEVYIPPRKRDVEGTIIIDGSSRTIKGTTLTEDEPISLTIENGEITKIENNTNGRALDKSLRYAESKAKFPWGIRRIGEFGIGLNPNAEIIGSTIIDEKSLGTAHIGIGSNYWFGGKIYAIVHLDQVFKNPKIKVDGKNLNPKSLNI